MKGMIEIYTGDGKGKTTAALGLALRAAGAGLRVYILQFLKSAGSSEYEAVKGIENIRMETVEESVKFVFMMNEAEKAKNRENNIRKFREAAGLIYGNAADVVIFDEIIGCMEIGQLPEEEVLELLGNKPENVEIVLTGRDADEELIRLADYVTEVRKIKHPYDKGEEARKGIEY